MKTKALIIGEAPNARGRGEPIAGRCGQRLADLCGCSLDEFLAAFDRENVLKRYPGSAGKGAAFDLAPATRRATALKDRFRRKRTVLLLGYRAAKAFGIRSRYFEPVKVSRATVVVVPHPSGINRWYNEPKNRRRMGRFLRRLAA